MVASCSSYSVRGMELAKEVMAYWKIKMAGGKTAVKRKSKTNAKTSHGLSKN